MANQPTKRAIVIDKDESFRKALSSVLEKRGYEVYAVPDPAFCPIYLNQECDCALAHVCTNIMIVDINQPGMKGLEFIQSQKKNRCKVKNIAIMSASWEGSELEQIESLGCKIFTKPFKRDELGIWLEDCEKQTEPDLKLTVLAKKIQYHGPTKNRKDFNF